MKEQKKDFIFFKTELLVEEAQNDPIKRAEMVAAVVESIAKIPDALKRSIYLKESANLLGVGEQIIVNEANKKRNELQKKQSKEAARANEKLEENKKLSSRFDK